MGSAGDGAAYQIVLQYLTKTNRPYSVIDITTNLGKDTNKAAVIRVLTRLTEENKVVEKVYGKQKVYYINQDQFPAVSDEDLKRLDSETSNLITTLEEIKTMTNNAEKEIASLSKCLTTAEAVAELQKIDSELPGLEKRLSVLKSNKVCVNPKEKAALQTTNEKFSSAWRKRKRMVNDMLNAILENYPKTKKVLMEEISIETDEDGQ